MMTITPGRTLDTLEESHRELSKERRGFFRVDMDHPRRRSVRSTIKKRRNDGETSRTTQLYLCLFQEQNFVNDVWSKHVCKHVCFMYVKHVCFVVGFVADESPEINIFYNKNRIGENEVVTNIKQIRVRAPI